VHEGAARCLLLPQQGVTIGRLVCIRQWQGKRASRLLSLRATLCLAAQQQHTGTLCICMHDMQARLYGTAQSQASGVLRRQQHGLAPSGGRALLLCTCISMQAGLNDTADGKMLMLPYSANLGMCLWLVSGEAVGPFRTAPVHPPPAFHINCHQNLESFFRIRSWANPTSVKRPDGCGWREGGCKD
jgi:hypothetical protein